MQPHRAWRQIQPQMLAAVLQQRTVAVDRPVQQGLEADPFEHQFQLSRGDLGHIGEVIDEAGQLRDLALDHAAGGARERVVIIGDPENVHGAAHRGQRIAQFVRQGGEKILAVTLTFVEQLRQVIALFRYGLEAGL
jgi:hypothetical protein